MHCLLSCTAADIVRVLRGEKAATQSPRMTACGCARRRAAIPAGVILVPRTFTFSSLVMPVNNSRVDPRSVIEHVANRHLPRDAKRRQLDLLQQMNAVHLQERGRDD